jgi:arginyl-tRNA synthetase
MSTLDLPGLAARLKGFGLGPIPQFSQAHSLINPLDIGRSYLAEILGHLVDCDSITAYNSIQSPNEIFDGDLTVILPKLCRGADWRAVTRDIPIRVQHSLPFAVHCSPD